MIGDLPVPPFVSLTLADVLTVPDVLFLGVWLLGFSAIVQGDYSPWLIQCLKRLYFVPVPARFLWYCSV
jgi:hypothetical protein